VTTSICTSPLPTNPPLRKRRIWTAKLLFRFGGIQQQNNDLYSFDTTGLSKGAGFEISGFLGSTVLRQLTISIDYRDGLIKFDYDPRHGNHNFE